MTRNIEFIRTAGSSRGRAKRPRPRRQVKKARRRSSSYVENVFSRQRRHQALQPSAVELVVWIDSTIVENIRQIHLFLQNKPKFPKAQSDVCSVFTKDYENLRLYKSLKNKPNTNPIQTQSKPILAQNRRWQSQNKANSNPISKGFGCRKLYDKTRKFEIYALSLQLFKKYNIKQS